jgi:GNAT superfamily N-acetyltransferase
MTSQIAFDLIIRGFAQLERGVHPVEERWSGNVPYLHWPERGRRGQEFSEEFFALDRNAAEVLAAVRDARPGPDHLIADVRTESDSPQGVYLAAGYEFGSQEPLLVADLVDSNSRPPADVPVARLETMAQVERVLATQRSVEYPQRLFSQELLDDPLISIRTVFAGSEFRAIGKMAVGGSGAYITDVMTMPEARRQGLGEAIMRALHADARVAGVRVAALTSTAMAEPLYERLGYLRVGTVTLFATPERE